MDALYVVSLVCVLIVWYHGFLVGMLHNACIHT